MNLIQRWTRREKILLFFIILLTTFLLAEWQPIQAANNSIAYLTTSQLYAQANRLSNQGNLEGAAAYLFAYIQRAPNEYTNNVQGHGDAVDLVFQNWISEIQSDRAELRQAKNKLEQVRNDVANCGRYPCSTNQGGVTSTFAEVFPSDMVKVCEDANYEGVR